MTAVNAGARLDRLPWAAFHRRMLWLIGLGICFDSFDVSLGTTVLPQLLHSGWSTLRLNADFISATFAGLSLGVIAAGIVGDRFGRRFSYQFNLALFGVASLAAVAVPAMVWLNALRFVMGIGLGAEFVIGYSTIAEFIPPMQRGRAISIVACCSLSAAFVGTLIGYIVIPTLGWRWMFAIAGTGALWAWYQRKDMPESPRWLEAAGRAETAERVLGAIEREVAPAGLLPAPAASYPVQSIAVPIRVVFSRPVLRRTLLAMGINVVIGVANYGFIQWFPVFFIKQGFTVRSSLGLMTLIQIGAPIGPFLGIWLSDRIGRQQGIIWASLLAAITGLVFSLQREVVPIVVCGLLLNIFVPWLLILGVGSYTPELFPTEYRLRGNGTAQLVGRLATFGSPYAVVMLYRSYSVFGVAVAIAALMVLMALGVAIFGIETRLQPLEAIAQADIPAAHAAAQPGEEAPV